MGAINPGENGGAVLPGHDDAPTRRGTATRRSRATGWTKGVEFIIPRGDIGTISDTSNQRLRHDRGGGTSSPLWRASPVTSRRTTEFNPPTLWGGLFVGAHGYARPQGRGRPGHGILV